jgi:hypothetical protein
MMIDITKIERIKLEPGEVLHVKCGEALTQSQAILIHKTFNKAFPTTEILISDAAADISLEAIKPEDKDEAEA